MQEKKEKASQCGKNQLAAVRDDAQKRVSGPSDKNEDQEQAVPMRDARNKSMDRVELWERLGLQSLGILRSGSDEPQLKHEAP